MPPHEPSPATPPTVTSTTQAPPKKFWARLPWWRIYLGILLVSHLVWVLGEDQVPAPEGWQQSEVLALGEGRQTLAWTMSGSQESNAPTLLLLHGSPGRGTNFAQLTAALPDHLRVLTVDLPGFGASKPLGPDLSAKGAASQIMALLDSLDVEKVHAGAWAARWPWS